MAISNINRAAPTQKAHVDLSWKEKWKAMHKHLDSIKDVFAKMFYIMTTIMPAMSAFTENKMYHHAKVMEKLSKLTNDLNSIQSQFNKGKNVWFPGVKVGISKANDILKIISTDPAFKNNKSLVSDVKSQICTIFGVKEGELDTSKGYPQLPKGHSFEEKTISNWRKAWTANDGVSLQKYNQAFTALSTNFNSQSATVQAEFKYAQSNDQQFLGIEKSIMSQFIKQEESSIRHFSR